MFMTVKFTKNQIEVLKLLLERADKSCDDNDSIFRGYISSALNRIINDKTAILPR